MCENNTCGELLRLFFRGNNNCVTGLLDRIPILLTERRGVRERRIDVDRFVCHAQALYGRYDGIFSR